MRRCPPDRRHRIGRPTSRAGLYPGVEMSETSLVREQLADVPDRPGVYVYRDAEARVLYVGKAKSLRRRVRSYFQAPMTAPDPTAAADPLAARPGHHPKIR